MGNRVVGSTRICRLAVGGYADRIYIYFTRRSPPGNFLRDDILSFTNLAFLRETEFFESRAPGIFEKPRKKRPDERAAVLRCRRDYRSTRN